MSHYPDILTGTADVGDVVDITITTYAGAAESGNESDPDSLTVEVQPPQGADKASFYWSVEGEDDSAELTRTGTGAFRLAYTPTLGGRHDVRAITTGNVAADPGYFNVRASNT